MIKRYIKKPVVIEALKFNGLNIDEVQEFLGESNFEWCPNEQFEYDCYIKTLEGTMRADAGDYIIKGIKGEFYPCKPDIFKLTYKQYKGKFQWLKRLLKQITK